MPTAKAGQRSRSELKLGVPRVGFSIFSMKQRNPLVFFFFLRVKPNESGSRVVNDERAQQHKKRLQYSTTL